jgi:hypothetical protein
MKTSTNRILTTHVGSIPRPESITTLLRARVSGQTIDEAQRSARVAEAMAEVVRRQAEVGIDVPSDGEMGKTSFLAYADDRLAGFVPMRADAPDVPSSNVGGAWARRIDSRREWRAFREYYQEYLPRAMPPATPPTVCQGPRRSAPSAPPAGSAPPPAPVPRRRAASGRTREWRERSRLSHRQAVSTSSTPGMLRAAAVSIRRMRACACAARTTAAWAWRGSAMSSVKTPAPVTKRRSSFRFIGAPT